MINCLECKKTFNTFLQLKQHMDFFHYNVHRFKCSHEGCPQVFTVLKRHFEHTKTHKSKNIRTPSATNRIEILSVPGRKIDEIHSVSSSNEDEVSLEYQAEQNLLVDKTVQQIRDKCLYFFIELMAEKSLNRSHIKLILNKCMSFTHGILECLKTILSATVMNLVNVEIRKNIESCFDNFIKNLVPESEFKCKKLLIKKTFLLSLYLSFLNKI